MNEMPIVVKLFVYLRKITLRTPQTDMDIFFMISFVAVLPYCWAVWRGLQRKNNMDVLLASLVFIITVYHLGMFYSTIIEDQRPSQMEYILHGVLICQVVPLVHVYICRKAGASYAKGTVYLCSLTMLLMLSRANIEIGWAGDFPMDKIDPMTVTIYHDGQVVWNIYNYEAIIIVQASFLIFKLSYLLGRMRKKNYHFSRRFRQMLAFLNVTVLIMVLSIWPDEQFWYEGHHVQYFTTYCLMSLGVLCLMIGAGYADFMLLDANEVPVTFDKSRQFAELAQRFTDMMDNGQISLSGNVLMDDVASLLGTNRTYLALMMKEEFGMTFSNYMNAQRINKAKHLIVASNYQAKMQDVAWQSGFSSLSSFNKVFKSATGVAPSEWRHK